MIVKDSKIVKKELSSRIKGDVLADELSLCIYSIDASILEQKPVCIILPKDEEDIIKVVDFCNSNGLSISARGAGTAKTGASLSKDGIVIDFTKYMNRILEINVGGNWVRVQPGIIYSELNRALRLYGKFFAPDPSSGDFCSLGGMVANNSGGPHSGKFGSTKEHVIDIGLILASGEQIMTSNWRNSNHKDIFANISRLIRNNYEEIMNELPHTKCNASGYNVFEFINGDDIDLAKLFVGSEGTLGVFTEIKLSIIDIPRHKSIGLAMFDNLYECGEGIMLINEMQPSALELIDRKIIEILINETRMGSGFIPKDTEVLLIIEFVSNEQNEPISKLNEVRDKLKKTGLTAFYIASNNREEETFWKIRKLASPILKKKGLNNLPLEFVEDTALNPKIIPDYIVFLRKLFDEYKLEASIFGHASKGNLHVNPEVDVTLDNYGNLINEIMNRVFEFVIANKGTLSGEHGNGLIRAHCLSKQYPKAFKVMTEIKNLLDPNNILNPGKVINTPNDSYLNYLKYKANSRNQFLISGSIIFEKNVGKCNGCATCKSYCPVYIATRDEEATPRAKATLLYSMLKAILDEKWAYKEEFIKIMNLCINCKRCLIECPSEVNIPALCIESKKMHNKKKGEKITDKLLINEFKIAKIAGKAPLISNLVFSSFVGKSIITSVLGLEKIRQMPAIQNNSIYEWYQSNFEAENKVIYYPGCFAFNHYVEEMKSTINILEKSNTKVKLTPFNCCGVAAISSGLKAFKKFIEENTEVLLPYLRNGWKVILSSASCGYTIKNEYLQYSNANELVDYKDLIYDIHEYIHLMYKRGELSVEFNSFPYKVFFHIPCHYLAQGCAASAIELLNLIPDIKLIISDDKCCGMAGLFGMKKKNFILSMEIGDRLFSSIRKENPDYIITNCGACKMQLEHVLKKRIYHSAEIIDFSISSNAKG